MWHGSKCYIAPSLCYTECTMRRSFVQTENVIRTEQILDPVIMYILLALKITLELV